MNGGWRTQCNVVAKLQIAGAITIFPSGSVYFTGFIGLTLAIASLSDACVMIKIEIEVVVNSATTSIRTWYILSQCWLSWQPPRILRVNVSDVVIAKVSCHLNKPVRKLPLRNMSNLSNQERLLSLLHKFHKYWLSKSNRIAIYKVDPFVKDLNKEVKLSVQISVKIYFEV